MVFKLVRADTSEPCKIKLPVGTHLIGRGKLLDCEDKRVSRQHGELEVTVDSVSIKSLNNNPCFYIRRSTDNTQILKEGCTINLSHGDRFGLLPCKYWYELLHCTSDLEDCASITENVTKDNVNMEEQVDNSTNGLNGDTQPYHLNEVVQETNMDQPLNDTIHRDPNMLQPLNLELNKSIADDTESPGSPSLIPMDNQTSNKDCNDNPSVPTPGENGEEKTIKRSNSTSSDDSSPVDVKKVKSEPDDTKDVQPGPSNDQASSSDTNKDNGVPPSPVKPPARERCIYGANCYRRNPQHKAEFSHPADSDYGEGPRGVCPYGASCRRREPRHWQLHSHPDGVQPQPPPARPGMQVVQRHGNIFYINAHSVNFHDDHFEVADSDGDSVDYDYEF